MSIRNIAMLLVHIITFKVQHLDYPIKIIHLNNASEFISKSFYDYCLVVRTQVEHPLAPIYT